MNSFQAIQDAQKARQHRIVIAVDRETGLFTEAEPPVIGFEITDTGIGFTDDNFNSFNTAYSDHKFDRGGKGLGRFMWLKAFDEVHIRSVFRSQGAEEKQQLWKRVFRFGFDYDPNGAAAERINQGIEATSVRLSGFRAPYKSECPRGVDQLALRLAEHFILVLMQPDCPELEIHDQGKRVSVNAVFHDHFHNNATSATFEISERQFQVNGFRLTSPRASKHRLIYAANHRGVLTEMLEQYIPNLSGRLIDQDGKSFVYLAVVQGDYLNEKVNNFRTDFELKDDTDEAQAELIVDDDLRRSDIRSKCVDCVESDLLGFIDDLNKSKTDRIISYVRSEAPQYKPMLRYLRSFVRAISPNASKTEIELALHRELHQREVTLKREGSRMLTEAAKQENYEHYRSRLAEFMERSNELGLSALAQYVAHRKIIIELFEKSLSSDKKTDRYPLEEAVHNILLSMRSTDEETLYSQQNLWIIDERLNYHSYIASDKPLNSHAQFESSSKKRPDLFIFDRKIAFAEGDGDGSPISSITVVEFKRPQRDDYGDMDNPLKQVIDQIQTIRSGKFKTERGRPIPVANEKIPAFAYIVCDITPSLREALVDRDAKRTPDGLSFYGYHSNHGIYFEVIDYGKLLTDAKRRNRVFFERLNLMDADHK
ncbi:hypothetical protein MKK67_04275 [Methylobacterium sp. J-072]|uniref:hypothetical protein n=1 Tax=Methylobacterium sp. J-072 TaxID=2836651 RepID=UPI001FBA6F7A|nr:hypothetical protein [Methylobacterium sp. J-072]MCJ2091727.1 hypothetical protein [Methylobacterium sp. J-072]